MNFIISAHAMQRSTERGIPREMIEEILSNPDKIIDDESGEDGQKVYQSLFTFSNEKTYLVQVFVNVSSEPLVVKTTYRTSKLNKYYES
ncbi:DUF4258 domain-containing protein [Spirosoma rhododendri]|uniref:DUF4258 domain-containing protein n=1 Tax=Spirosoma rhododendri TaxID=2728024 RepID=A0A7L5DPH4_9BACT|nr:DUF4258 domain-containing protein [Spirosoma rhododendri]QJD78408.1 DUF4258 domain-containing protein [Spirosoma rhododendri]